MKNAIALLLLGAISAAAQGLTADQKEADFRSLANVYAGTYAPLDWKKQLFGFDALAVRPWVERARATETDLDFYELCVEYISNLRDTHVSFSLPSDFVARLGFGVDLYDDALLIETIDRLRLPAARYPFANGDELLSIDGEDTKQLLEKFTRYAPQGNPRAARRQAAARLTTRPQSRMPHAPDVGAEAVVRIRRQNGQIETYTLPWIKTGTPLEVGPVPSPRSVAKAQRQAAQLNVDPLEELRHSGVDASQIEGVLGYGARNPVFLGGLPNSFTRRLGGAASDFFYSGVFRFEELRIGYIRIPNYSPPNQALALAQFDAEVAFFNANTDGLIVDEMRNTGGNLCFGEALASRLHTQPFRATGFSTRAFWARLINFQNALINAKSNNMPTEVLEQYEVIIDEMTRALREGDLLTRALPLCTSNLRRQPNRNIFQEVTSYIKPIMVLIDDFSTSTADSFPAMMQDSGRAVIYGMRTNGAGGNNIGVDAGVYSESFVGLTIAIQVRPNPIATEEYPTSDFVENVGVRPDVPKDYMTKENLLTNGARFVDDFLQAMATYIRQRQ